MNGGGRREGKPSGSMETLANICTGNVISFAANAFRIIVRTKSEEKKLN